MNEHCSRFETRGVQSPRWRRGRRSGSFAVPDDRRLEKENGIGWHMCLKQVFEASCAVSGWYAATAHTDAVVILVITAVGCNREGVCSSVFAALPGLVIKHRSKPNSSYHCALHTMMLHTAMIFLCHEDKCMNQHPPCLLLRCCHVLYLPGRSHRGRSAGC